MVFRMFHSCFTISTDKVSDCSTNDVGRVDSCYVNNNNCNKKKNKFSWDAIMKKSMKVIGSGGFSTVYLADQLPGEKNLTAVKIQWACTDRLAQIHDQELQILSRISHHPNIIKFVGHFKSGSDEKCGLLFEYASNGTLHDKLHTLTWKQRTLIAYQLASALEYLHSMQIIHGDIKASNILLDENLNCKLCDFGSATLGGGFTSMVLPPLPSTLNRRRNIIMGSQGYVDPYYLKTGLVSKKNDIYSYGVVLLELITGREAFSLIDEKKKIIGKMMSEVVVDPHCVGLDAEEVKVMVSIAGLCLGPSPMVRPCANELVASLTNFKTISSSTSSCM